MTKPPAVSERSQSKPPLVGRVLLRLLAPRRLHEAIAGDLEEMWRHGKLTRAAYLREVLRSLGDVFRYEQPVAQAFRRKAAAGVLHDIRFGARMMARSPGFAASAVVTLAIGIGGSAAMFSTVNPTLFQPLPYPQSDRIISICDRGQDGSCLDVTFGTYRELLARTHAFERLAVIRAWQPVLAENGEAERLEGQRVTSDYFATLGVSPVLGRDFTDADDPPSAPRVAILSDGLWRRRFAADPSILGRDILFGSAQYLVIAVMPRTFENVLAPAAEVWTTLQYDPALPTDSREWGHHLRMVGRLREGVLLEAASTDFNAIAATPLREFPRVQWASLSNGLTLASLKDELTRSVWPVLLAFSAAVMLVLVIACANVANLLLARAVHRQREFAMRAALGAGQWRLLRQLVIEGLLIAVPAGVLGVIAAHITINAMIALAPEGLTRVEAIAVDARALGFALAVTTIVGIAIALLPAMQALRRNLQSSLQQNTRSSAGGHRLARQALVVTEVALALILLVSGGLLFRSLREFVAIAPGFASEHLVAAQVQVAGARFQQNEASHQFFDQVLEATRVLPGVTAAALASQLPFCGQIERFGVFTQYDASLDPNGDSSAYRYAVSPGYLETMGVRLRKGRTLEARDRAGAPLAVVISETLARRRFAGVDAIGEWLRIGPTDGPRYTVVGIVADVKQWSLSADDGEAVYITPQQWFFADAARWLIIRSTAQEGLPSAIRAAVRSVDPAQPVVRLTSLDALLSRSTAARRFALVVFSVFGGIALVLAVTGLYSALARSVVERTREIGVRAALGASRGEIIRMFLGQGIAMTGVGVLIGVAGAVVATRLLETLLFGTTRLDPITYAAVIALFGIVASAASCIPAVRAVRIDPAITLRAE
ncbi:MAG: ABC transporter permease [Acidobacteria bacterium]|nr:ABC transporter permease [Acidobacteriota bacterium]